MTLVNRIVSLRPNSVWSSRLQLGLLMLALVVMLAATLSPDSQASTQIRYIAPRGTGDGVSWESAAAIQSLPRLISELPDGGEIRLASGTYSVPKPIYIESRLGATAPITIHGVDPASPPLIVGTRVEPYASETADSGRPLFRLSSGANYLTFSNLSAKNFANAVFILSRVDHMIITDVTATNVRRFIENPDVSGYDVTSLTVLRTKVLGYSKQAIRLQNNSHDVRIEDVVADSQFQDGDHFAMGFHLTGTVHDVTFRRVTARNNVDIVNNAAGDYWNGDGFAAERGTYNLVFRSTAAEHNTDAGYDIKASDVVFVRAVASGNKRNFRLWGSNIRMRASRGAKPIRRGGSGTQAQVWAGSDAQFSIARSKFLGGDAHTVVFALEEGVLGSARSTTVKRAAGSRLSSLGADAQMTLNGFLLIN
jgi:hypothetical protein